MEITSWKKGLGLVFASIIAFTTPLRAATHFVDVLDNSYSPSFLQINSGDTVTWTNQDEDDDAHSATSDNAAWNGGLMIGLDDQFSVTFPNTGTFAYHDIFDGFNGTISVIAGNAPPSVSITNPAPGSAFAATATFLIEASASDSDGSIASVEFFVDATSVGIDTIAPYSATATNLAEGSYTLFAVATDNLGATTTDFINISVTNAPVTEAVLSTPKIEGGQFQFDISGLTVGKTNLVQASTNLTEWISIQTNLAGSSSATFSQTQTTSFGQRFYRVVQLP